MVSVDGRRCGYCGCCVSVCPLGALDLQETHLVVSDDCSECNLCVQACPMGALSPQGTMQRAEDSLCTPRMMRDAYDVVVIGAGPAGSMAAWEAAARGLSVLLLEKRQEIGSPVRCAEGIRHASLTEYLEPDPRWISAHIRSAEITSVHEGEAQTWRSAEAPGEHLGYVLERRVFDRALAERATQAGAHVRVKTAVSGLVREGDTVVGVRVDGPWGRDEIAARVVIGADGVESRVGPWAGLDTTLPQADQMACAQFLMSGVDIDPGCTSYFIDYSVAPGGYAWVFPKGEHSANVGLGIQAGLGQVPPVDLLTRFVESHRFLAQGSVVTLVVGGVPVAPPPAHIVTDGCLLVGDAARQVDPLTGGGIANAMAAGRLAAQVVAEAISGGDVSRTSLVRYEQAWMAGVGREMARNQRLRSRFPPCERQDKRFLGVFAMAVGAGK